MVIYFSDEVKKNNDVGLYTGRNLYWQVGTGSWRIFLRRCFITLVISLQKEKE
jgi:hypothetical protein